MSIGTVLTSIGTFLAGPVMTGISNVATLGTLGVSIATKVDTHDIKSSVGGLRSDIASVSNDVLALSADIADFRKERQWTTAINGGIPVSVVNGGNPQYVQLQIQPQQPQVQPVQQIAQPVQPVQQVAQQPQVAQPAQEYITKNDFNTAISNIVGAMPTIVGQAVQQAINAASPATPPATPPTTPAAPVNPTTPPATPPTNPANPANPA